MKYELYKYFESRCNYLEAQNQALIDFICAFIRNDLPKDWVADNWIKKRTEQYLKNKY